MTEFGFCHQCRDDTPTDPGQPRPTCAVCGYPSIPPSWGKRTQAWRDGGWAPAIPKPVGFVRPRPKGAVPPDVQALAPSAVFGSRPQAPAPCAWCGETFAPRQAGGTVQQYCRSLCKNRAQHARVMAKKRKGAAA